MIHPLRPLAALAAFAVVTGTALATVPPPAQEQGATSATELSAARRVYHRRYPRHYDRPRYSAPVRGDDPALNSYGRPYRVPEHLRGQCYIDEGYGRFSACPNY